MAPSRTYTEDADGVRCCIVTREDVLAGYESDEEYVDALGYRSITEEEGRKLYRQFEESDGFDIDELPNCFYFGPRRVPDSELSTNMEKFRRYANIAIQDYNTKQNTNLKVVNVVKVNNQIVSGLNCYITFEASGPSSGHSATYQAKLSLPIGVSLDNPIVLLCRPKSFSSSSNP